MKNTSGLKPPFSKDNQPKNRGRKKGSKSMTTILKDFMSVAVKNIKLLGQYEKLFPEYFKNAKAGKTPKELIMLRLMTKALEGDTKSIDMILDRTEGKVTQTIEADVNSRQIVVSSEKEKSLLEDDYS